jgi:hypothetical protein
MLPITQNMSVNDFLKVQQYIGLVQEIGVDVVANSRESPYFMTCCVYDTYSELMTPLELSDFNNDSAFCGTDVYDNRGIFDAKDCHGVPVDMKNGMCFCHWNY